MLTLLTFIALLILRKVSICRGWFLFGVCLLNNCSVYTMKSNQWSDQWITIWWAKFELKCLLLIFIYFNSKFKVSCKSGEFECLDTRTHSEGKHQRVHWNPGKASSLQLNPVKKLASEIPYGEKGLPIFLHIHKC